MSVKSLAFFVLDGKIATVGNTTQADIISHYGKSFIRNVMRQERIGDYARTLLTCPACGRKKDKGGPLCWECWSIFKPFDGPLNEWLKKSGKKPVVVPKGWKR